MNTKAINLTLVVCIISCLLFLSSFYLANQYHYIREVTTLTIENHLEYADLEYKRTLFIIISIISAANIIGSVIMLGIFIVEKLNNSKED